MKNYLMVFYVLFCLTSSYATDAPELDELYDTLDFSQLSFNSFTTDELEEPIVLTELEKRYEKFCDRGYLLFMDPEQRKQELSNLEKRNNTITFNCYLTESDAIDVINDFFNSLQKNNDLDKNIEFGFGSLSNPFILDAFLNNVKNLKFTAFTELCFDSNTLGDEGAQKLADIFDLCKNLKILRLDYNHIGDKGAQALVNQLHHLQSLEILSLFMNSFSREMTNALTDKAITLPKLSLLIVDQESFDQEEIEKLRDQKNESLLTPKNVLQTDEPQL